MSNGADTPEIIQSKRTLDELIRTIPPNLLKAVSVTRLESSQSWKTRLWNGLKRFAQGFATGAIGTATVLLQTPSVSIPSLLTGKTILLVAMGGLTTGLGMGLWKVAKEVSIDKKVAEFRVALSDKMDTSTYTFLGDIINRAFTIAKAKGITPSEGLALAVETVENFVPLPTQAHELLSTVFQALAPDSPGGEGLTPEEVQGILGEYLTIDSATQAIIAEWNRKNNLVVTQ